MASKTNKDLREEALDSLKGFRWKKLSKVDITEIQKRINQLLQTWLEGDILLHHAGRPVGSVVISASYSEDDIASNIKISLQTL